MSDRSRFNLRLTEELDQLIHQASRRAGRSKNAIILDALEWRFQPDNAVVELAEALQPLVEVLSDEQRTALLDAVRTMARGGKGGS